MGKREREKGGVGVCVKERKIDCETVKHGKEERNGDEEEER